MKWPLNYLQHLIWIMTFIMRRRNNEHDCNYHPGSYRKWMAKIIPDFPSFHALRLTFHYFYDEYHPQPWCNLSCVFFLLSIFTQQKMIVWKSFWSLRSLLYWFHLSVWLIPVMVHQAAIQLRIILLNPSMPYSRGVF